MTIGTVKGIQIHDQREKEFSHTNSDIDFSKSNLNEDLYNSKNINYNHEIKNKIKKLNLTRAVRKDAIVMCQSLITSDKPFFDKLSSQEQKQFFKDSFEFVKETYGEKNIISANIHYDEKTPHMHINFVPITKDGRLCAKDLFKRVDLIKLHDNFSKHCKEHGYDLERGESKGDLKKHLSVEDFKIKTKQEELGKNKIEFNKANNELNVKFKRLKNLTTNISSLEQTSVKKSFIGSKVTLQEDDYNKILKLAEKAVLNETALNKLKQVNASLERNNLSYHKGFTEYSNKYLKLKKEHKELTGNVVGLIKEHKIMTTVLDKYNLMPEFKNELKNEKETEKISRKSKSEGLER